MSRFDSVGRLRFFERNNLEMSEPFLYDEILFGMPHDSAIFVHSSSF
jgi:hypothetical protein